MMTFLKCNKSHFPAFRTKNKHEYFSAYRWREIGNEKRCLNKKKPEVWEASIYGVSGKGFLVEISRLSWANDVHNKGAVLWLRNPPLFWLIASLRFMLIALLSHDFMRGNWNNGGLRRTDKAITARIVETTPFMFTAKRLVRLQAVSWFISL